MIPKQYALREGLPSDHAFVYATLLRDYRTSDVARTLADDRRHFFEGHHSLVEKLLRRARLDVACGIEDPDVIVGWILWEPALPMRLHYIYVREPYRRLGVAQDLLANCVGTAPVIYTHRTRLVATAIRHKIPDTWAFNAYAAL